MYFFQRSVIFVNRGWVPREKLQSQSWSKEEDEVTLEAVVTAPEEVRDRNCFYINLRISSIGRIICSQE
jgi:cytochrome oxidase assembly protein ShyY1